MQRKFIMIIVLIWFSSNMFSQSSTATINTTDKTSLVLVSKQIPIISSNTSDISTILKDTVWMTTDLVNNRDIYMRFQENKYANISFPRGSKPDQLPDQNHPITFYKNGNSPNESIFIVASNQKILYYSFRLLTPYYLLISEGFNTGEPLLDLSIEDYFKNGTILRLVF